MDLKKQRMHHLCLLHPYGHNKRIENNIVGNDCLPCFMQNRLFKLMTSMSFFTRGLKSAFYFLGGKYEYIFMDIDSLKHMIIIT